MCIYCPPCCRHEEDTLKFMAVYMCTNNHIHASEFEVECNDDEEQGDNLRLSVSNMNDHLYVVKKFNFENPVLRLEIINRPQ